MINRSNPRLISLSLELIIKYISTNYRINLLNLLREPIMFTVARVSEGYATKPVAVIRVTRIR